MCLVLTMAYNVSAKSLVLELCTNEDCYGYKDNIQLDKNASIILKATIINDAGNWMCWNGLQYNFNLVSENVRDSYNNGKKNIQGYISNSENNAKTKFCFSNKNSVGNEIYIPLREYSSLESEERKGEWKISDFNFYFTNLEYYNNLDMQKPTSQSSYTNVPFTANEIRFFVYTEEPKKGWYTGFDLKLRLGIIALNVIFAGLAITLWGYVFTNRRRKPIKSALVFTILTISLALFGFLN